MSVREYIGARYVPLFADPIEWDDSISYEPLTVVTYQGGSYVSKQSVPVGINIENTNYWLLWADYNAQIEAYRQEVLTFDGRITQNSEDIADETTARENADTALAADIATDISAEATARENADTALSSDISAEATARENADTALSGDISAEATARENADTALSGDISAEATARENADIALQDAIDELNEKTNNQNFYIYPLQEGRIRINTEAFTSSSPQNQHQTQGLCVKGSYIYLMLIGSGTTAHVYRKLIGADSIEKVAEVETGHSGDMIYVAETDKFWISHGENGNVSVFDSGFNLVTTITIGSGAILIAYDKVTGKVYANDYWGATYEVNPVTYAYEEINVQINANSYKQSMAAHDGIIYVLFSFPNCIEAYNLDNELIAKYYIGNNHYTPIGETEGIDTNSKGDFYMSSYVNARNSSIWLNPIWYLSMKEMNIEPAYNYYSRDVQVSSHTNANMLTHQRPDGTNEHPFPTIDEALLYIYQNRNLNRLSIYGNHSMEQPEITLPYLAIQGQPTDGVKASIGKITAMGSLSVFGINFAPQIQVDHVISGFQNTSIVLASNVTKSSDAVITGTDVSSLGPIHQGTTETATLSVG